MPGQFSSFGPESMGSRLWQKDFDEAQMHDLAMRTGEQQLAHRIMIGPEQVALARAQAQEHAIKAKQAEMEMQALADWRSQRTGAQPGQGGGEAVAGVPQAQLDEMLSLADLKARTGKASEAARLVSGVSQAHARQARIEQAAVASERQAFQQQQAVAQAALGFIRGANNQQEWDAARMSFIEQYGMDLPIFSKPFSPQLRDAALQQGLTEMQARQVQHNTRMEGIAADRAASARATADVSRRVGEARIGLIEARTKNLGKAGAQKAPNAAELKPAQDILRKNHPGIANDLGEFGLAAASIAGQAKFLVTQNPGLTYPQAIVQAYEDHKDDLKTESSVFGLGDLIGRPGKTTLNLQGRTPSTAFPSPASSKDLRRGRWYKDASGAVGRWTGSGFILADPADLEDDDGED